MTHKTVAVIGAGPAGLPTIKNFLDLGFQVTAYERQDGVGGNWRFDDHSGHSSVFETTHIISSRYTSEYADYPLPPGTPDYPSHTQLLQYFEGYARRFGLHRHIRFGTEVLRCEPVAGGRWAVTSRPAGSVGSVGSAQEQTEVYDALCVANGHHHQPRWPQYPGQFSGEFLHSHDYKRAAPFARKRVLVIGGGNSACDVAVETSRVSAKTTISWRRGYDLIPKFLFGQPVDVLFYRFRHVPLPPAVREWAFRQLVVLAQGRNRDIGLPEPTQGILATHPTLNSDLYLAIRHGKVHPKGDIACFEGQTVFFKDGSREDFDVVVACTGYHLSHPFLDPQLIDLSGAQVRLYHKMIPERWPNLYFIGLFQPLGCIWPGAELQAKLAARHLAGLWQPAGDLSDLIDQELAHPDVRQVHSPRHTITVNDLAFRERLKAELARAMPVSRTPLAEANPGR